MIRAASKITRLTHIRSKTGKFSKKFSDNEVFFYFSYNESLVTLRVTRLLFSDYIISLYNYCSFQLKSNLKVMNLTQFTKICGDFYQLNQMISQI